MGPLIFEELHKQISTRLPSRNIYGFGENRHESFKHDLNYQNWPIWGRDEGPENVKIFFFYLYTSIIFIVGLCLWFKIKLSYWPIEFFILAKNVVKLRT